VSEATVTREGEPRSGRSLAGLRLRLGTDGGEAAVALRVLYAAMAAYAVLFIFAAVMHYLVFQEARLDNGDMVQPVWNTLHGHFLESTATSGQQANRLGSHVDPFLLLFVPFLWVWSSPLLLLTVQVLAVTSGVLPVFWLARKHLDSPRAAAHFALVYLLYPATQFNAFTIGGGFHAVSLAVPLVLYAVWFLDEDRLVAFSVVALLAFTTKEEIPLAIGCLGIWYAVRKGRWLFGLGVFAVGLAVTVFDFFWIIPHFSPTGADQFTGRYRAVGGTPGGMAHKLVTDPMAFVHAVATGHKALFLFLLFFPALGLFVLEPLLMLGAVPDLAINLLSHKPDQTLIGYQYTAGIAPFVIAATIFAVARFRSRADGLSLAVLVATGMLALFSPINHLGADVRALGSPQVSAKSHALGLVPGGVPVAASNQLGGYLSERRFIYQFPRVRQAHWIVVDVNDPTETGHFKRYVRQYESAREWRVVFSSHGIAVLRRQRS
jgi:uncharacterized membrane protein